MNQTYEGTSIQIKVGGKKGSQEERVQGVEDVRPTGNPLSGQKENSQNPEGQAADEKEVKPSNEENLRHRVGRLWTELTTLKKVMVVGGVVAVILIAVLLALLAVSLSYKPKIVILRSGSLPLPNSPEVLNYYQVQASRKSLTAKDRNANFTMTTVSSPKTARLLQEDGSEDGEVSALVLTFDYPEEGVTIKATSPVDLIVQYDYDQAIAFYSEHSTSRRLLFELELRAALRQLQDAPLASDPSDTAYTFDDSASIIRDAEQSALRAYAASTSADPSEVEMTYSETTDIVQQADGSFALDSSAKSSRLLTALHGLRGLEGEWTTIFDEINSKVLQARIEETQAAINEFFPNGDAAAAYTEDSELKAVLQASNFNPDNDVDVEEEVATTARLLQKLRQSEIATEGSSASPSASNITTDSKASIKNSTSNSTTNANSTAASQKNNNAGKEGKGKGKQTKPINPRARKGRGKGSKKRTISKPSYDSVVKCTRRNKKLICDLTTLNDTKSAYQIDSRVRKNSTSTNSTSTNSTVKINKKARYQFKYESNVKKNSTNASGSPKKPKKNNLNTEPDKKNTSSNANDTKKSMNSTDSKGSSNSTIVPKESSSNLTPKVVVVVSNDVQGSSSASSTAATVQTSPTETATNLQTSTNP